MNRRGFLLGMGTVTVGGSALVTSGAFSRLESQRNVTIDVVGDEDAYLRLVYADVHVECANSIVLVDLTNQLKDDIDEINVEITGSNDDITLGNISVPNRLDVGHSEPVYIDVECTSSEPVTTTVTFEITVSGPDQEVLVIDREIQITCNCIERFNAKGISFIAFCGAHGAVDVIDVTVTHANWSDEPTGIEWTTATPVTEVLLMGGREWYLYTYPGGATAGTEVLMDEASADYVHKGSHPFRFVDEDDEPIDTYERCPQSPCDGAVGVKINEENDQFDLVNLEVTKKNC